MAVQVDSPEKHDTRTVRVLGGVGSGGVWLAEARHRCRRGCSSSLLRGDRSEPSGPSLRGMGLVEKMTGHPKLAQARGPTRVLMCWRC